MADTIKRVTYYYTKTADNPGEGGRVLGALREQGVNLLAFHAFPEGGESQLDFFPEDEAKFLAAAIRKSTPSRWSMGRRSGGEGGGW